MTVLEAVDVGHVQVDMLQLFEKSSVTYVINDVVKL